MEGQQSDPFKAFEQFTESLFLIAEGAPKDTSATFVLNVSRFMSIATDPGSPGGPVELPDAIRLLEKARQATAYVRQ
jgi:hypothetical protein